jgi:hypothetical protein
LVPNEDLRFRADRKLRWSETEVFDPNEHMHAVFINKREAGGRSGALTVPMHQPTLLSSLGLLTKVLLRILEISQVNAGVKAISAAWPNNHGKPTPRAITERLIKIRNGAKATGTAGHFSVTRAKTSSQGGTPHKLYMQNPNRVKRNTTWEKDGKRKRRLRWTSMITAG